MFCFTSEVSTRITGPFPSAVIVRIIGPLDQIKAPRNLPEWVSNPFVISAVLCVLVLAVCIALYCVCVKAMRNKEF